jgi:hypothetical protein
VQFKKSCAVGHGGGVNKGEMMEFGETEVWKRAENVCRRTRYQAGVIKTMCDKNDVDSYNIR